MKTKERIEDVTAVAPDDLIEGVRLVFRNRTLMWVTPLKDQLYSLEFNLTEEEASHIKALRGDIKTYKEHFRLRALSMPYLPDGTELRPPILIDCRGDALTVEQLKLGIPNGTRADIYIWAKFKIFHPEEPYDEGQEIVGEECSSDISSVDCVLPIRLTGLQLKPPTRERRISISEMINEEVC